MMEYGEQEIIRFMFDKIDKKLVITTKQEILEDGVLRDHITPSIIAKNDDFDTIMDRLFPAADKAVDKLETEAKAILCEQWEIEKQKRKAAKKKE